MDYVPPAGDELEFDLIEAYSPPAGDELEFDLDAVPPAGVNQSSFFLIF